MSKAIADLEKRCAEIKQNDRNKTALVNKLLTGIGSLFIK